jgi:hypothetical protein
MIKKSQRNIKDQVAKTRQVIAHEALGAGVLASKLKHKVTRLNKLIRSK